MRPRKNKSWLRRVSRRLTFNKLTFGKGRQPRRSRRIDEQDVEYLSDTPSFLAKSLRWLGYRVGWIIISWIFVILLYIAFGTTWFYVYDIELKGEIHLTKEEIYNQSKLEAWSMFWLDSNAVAKLVEEHPLVAKATVSALLPNQIEIEIAERVPVAVWQSKETCYFVDSEGVLFDLREPLERLPIIHDKSATPISKDKEIDPIIIRTVQELTQLMPEQNEFEWEPNLGISFKTEGKWQVIFGDYTRLRTKVAAFRAFMKQPNQAMDILWLDLSRPKKPYVRKAESSTVNP